MACLIPESDLNEEITILLQDTLHIEEAEINNMYLKGYKLFEVISKAIRTKYPDDIANYMIEISILVFQITEFLEFSNVAKIQACYLIYTFIDDMRNDLNSEKKKLWPSEKWNIIEPRKKLKELYEFCTENCISKSSSNMKTLNLIAFACANSHNKDDPSFKTTYDDVTISMIAWIPQNVFEIMREGSASNSDIIKMSIHIYQKCNELLGNKKESLKDQPCLNLGLTLNTLTKLTLGPDYGYINDSDVKDCKDRMITITLDNGSTVIEPVIFSLIPELNDYKIKKKLEFLDGHWYWKLYNQIFACANCDTTDPIIKEIVNLAFRRDRNTTRILEECHYIISRMMKNEPKEVIDKTIRQTMDLCKQLLSGEGVMDYDAMRNRLVSFNNYFDLDFVTLDPNFDLDQ
jgi:hypothetical protein